MLLGGVVHSQEVVVGLDYNPVLKSLPKEKTKRTKTERSPLQIPFFDDFSATSILYPDTSLWEDNYAYVNQSYPIMPPTIGVVTLDALDANGNLYAHASTTPFGADTLTSRKIRLDSVFPESSTPLKLNPVDSIYFSFYYQPGGGYGTLINRTGGTPDKQDSLILEFYRQDSAMWQNVWTTGGFDLGELYDSTGYFFAFVMIPITDTVFLTADFQFRFRNICSLSNNSGESNARKANCDQWHIDYIYLDKGRKWSSYDSSVEDIAFVTPASSILKKYEAMPSRQFKKEELKRNFENTIANLYKEIRPCKYQYHIYDENGTLKDFYDGGNTNVKTFFPNFAYHDNAYQITPEITYSFPDMKSGKNLYNIVHVAEEGISLDYNPQNDTIKFEQIFWNYYAYDDGSAENGYGLETDVNTTPKIAYRLDLNKQDTLSAVTIFFNHALNNSNNIQFKVVIWENGGGSPGKVLYEDSQYRSLKHRDSVPVGLNKPDKFILDRYVTVRDTIYFGIVQRSRGYINMGFDRNKDASEFIFYDAGAGWENSYQKGALMMRAYFGEEATVGISTPKKEQLDCKIYPNPAREYIQIDIPEDIYKNDIEIRIFDVMGREVYKAKYENRISIKQFSKEMYIVQVIDKKNLKTFTGKLIITD